MSSLVTISRRLPLPSRLMTYLFSGKCFIPSLPINKRALPPTIRCLIASWITTRSLEALMESITIRSILEKLRSSSLRTVGSNSVPSFSSLICSLKNEVCGGSNANISFEANVVTDLAPTDCHGHLSALRVDFFVRSSSMR